MKTVSRPLLAVLALVCSFPSVTPFEQSQDKNFHVIVRRWDQAHCLGEGPAELWPRAVVQHNTCQTFEQVKQGSQQFVSFRNKWMKHWEDDKMWMYGTCRFKVYQEEDCQGSIIADITNFDACHSFQGKTGLSVSVYCDHNKPVAPGTRFWDTQNHWSDE